MSALNNSQTLFDFLEDTTQEAKSKLTVLSMGLGQDSVTILLMLIFQKEFRAKYAPNDLVVVFSDTSNEHPLTYQYRDEVVIPLCKEHNIPFYTISNDMGYHGKTWQSLTGHWESGRAGVQTLAFLPTCSHNLKINPQEKFIDKYIADNYNVAYNGAKLSYKRFSKLHGKLSWLIGIALNEESRTMGGEFFIIKDQNKIIGKQRTLKGNNIFEVIHEDKTKTKYCIIVKDNQKYVEVKNKLYTLEFKYTPVYDAKWKNQSINTIYPLIDEKMDRTACQNYISSLGFEIPCPSSCMFCPYGTGYIELLWLYRTYPLSFNKWAQYEQAKLDEYSEDIKEVENYFILNDNDEKIMINKKDLSKYDADEIITTTSLEKIVNHAVSCKHHKDGEKKGQPVKLYDLLDIAIEKHGHMTLEELQIYKWSHGKCIPSKY